MSKKTNWLLLLTLVCLVLGLLTALTPLSDIDQDGCLDSLVTEGMILFPGLAPAPELFLLLTGLPAVCLAAPRPFSALFFSPPIYN